MRRRFEELDTVERLRWTIHLGLEPNETGRWAGKVTVEDMPLYAYNNEDAAHWIQYLIREHVKGYTTAETVEQLLDEFITASPFIWLEDPKITAKVHKLLDSSRADQRLSKLLSAGTTLVQWRTLLIKSAAKWQFEQCYPRRKQRLHLFVLAVTQGVGGQMKRITVVDRFIYHDQHIKKFAAFSTACKELTMELMSDS